MKTPITQELFGNQLPIALKYGNERIRLMDLDWTIQKKRTPACEMEQRTALLADCVSIELTIRSYEDENALEWFIKLHNTSAHDTEIFSDVNFAHFQLDFEANTSPFFLDYNGSNEQFADFMEHRTQLFHHAKRVLRCDGGRSSSVQLPYFHLLMGDYGYTLAVGWTGQWHATLVRPSDAGELTFEAGLENANFRLHAGECVTLPCMLVQRWEGDEEAGFNAYRRFAKKHIVPKQANGQCIQSPLCMSSWGGSPNDVHLQNMATIRNHKLNGNTYWIDAGWYGMVSRNNSESDGEWYRNAGSRDWQPSTDLYPHGMEEISDAAHAAGLGFLLWYEPERSRSSVQRVAAHPDWYIGVRQAKECDLLLDLGNEAARKWMEDVLANAIERYHMQVLRIDFNFGPLPWWRYADAQDRQGISELRYVAGFYQLWDTLLARFPGLVIDNCASGGRRLDYEACRRSIPLFRTDYGCFGKLSEPTGMQIHTYYLSRFLPVNATSVISEDMDTYRFRSALAGGITLPVPPEDSPEEMWPWYRQRMDEAKRICEYALGDLWPMTGCSASERDWMAYQLDLHEQERGVVLAYRREKSMLTAMNAQLRGLDPTAQYELEDLDKGIIGLFAGETLISGWPLDITSPRSCRVLFYKRV